MLALQLTLLHKIQLSLGLEEFEHKYLFIEMIKGSELMTPEYLYCLIDFLYYEFAFFSFKGKLLLRFSVMSDCRTLLIVMRGSGIFD